MRTRTATPRTLLAAAILAALPLAVGTLRADPVPPVDDARTRSVVEHRDGPRWIYLTGEGPLGPELIACPLGGWRCALHLL